MCGVLPRVLPQQPNPTSPPLPPHLLRPVPGEAVQARDHHADHPLPAVPLDHVHPGRPGHFRRPVHRHRDLESHHRARAGGEGGSTGGFERSKDTTQVEAI